MSEPAHFLRPSWPAPPNVGSIMSQRLGGVSKPPFDSLNLGQHVGDDAAAVSSNLDRFRSQLPARTVLLKQVHGVGVASLGSESRNGLEADASVTTDTGLACCVLIADCLPILFTDRKGRAVAAAHAGWRGLAGTEGLGVVESTCHALRVALRDRSDDKGSEAGVGDILAWLGPCIGQKAFEVGEEVRQAFVSQQPSAAAMFRPGMSGKFHADLQGLARQRLAALGIRAVFGNDGSAAWCTHANASRFFSHRRDHLALGGSGRMAAAIWRI